MAKLEELTRGTSVKGVLPDALVSVVDVKWIGTFAVELTYKDHAGKLGSELLYRDREPTLEIAETGRPWSFDGDGGLFRLVSEANRIRLAYLFDPLLAVHTSLVDPLPHQITAVYESMLPRQPLRFLLADDPGAGKTIMAGLLIKELLARGDVQRCLIVCPGSLVEQWQDELDRRFHLPFEIMTNDTFEAARTGNWFMENPLAICRLDKLSRNEDVKEKLKQNDWDLIICDEAHKMCASFFGNEVKYTKRYRLGQLLSEHSRHFLLMTATPHNGKEEDFQLFMALLDGDRFEGKFRDGVHVAGCVQPGESTAPFGDSLRHLSNRATYLYVDGKRYWYSTQPTVTRLAEDRAAQLNPHDVTEEIVRRVRKEQSRRGDFEKVHACPSSHSDVPDEPAARLVILGPEHAHTGKSTDSPARKAAAAMLESRGNSPRNYKNAIVFLAADTTRLRELEQAAREYLAWKSITDEQTVLNLDPFQSKQAETKCKAADDTVEARIPETFQWLLVPGQTDPKGAMEWNEVKSQGEDALAVRASKKLRNLMMLLTQMGGNNLRLDLDRVPLWRGDHVSVKLLAEDVAKHLYLPRLKNSDVLLGAVRDGIGRLTWESESFAYAERYDEQKKRYIGLQAGEVTRVLLDNLSVLVKPEVAARQIDGDRLERERAEALAREASSNLGGTTVVQPSSGNQPPASIGARPVVLPPTQRPKPRRFHGSVNLNTLRLGSDAGRIAEEVVQHLSSLTGVSVEVTLEIVAEIPDGASDELVRTITENCRTLRFRDHGFEES